LPFQRDVQRQQLLAFRHPVKHEIDAGDGAPHLFSERVNTTPVARLRGVGSLICHVGIAPGRKYREDRISLTTLNFVPSISDRPGTG
jgi:hypothetical protein